MRRWGKDKELISLSDIYKGLWKCRDFELSHYWQRAIFLTAFLMACYAGYGAFIMSCLTASSLKVGFEMGNCIALAMTLVGLFLSLLWLMMAKGSKTWYERYEAAITAFVEKYGDDKNVFERDAGKYAGFCSVNMETFKAEPISDWLWKPCGGTYSVSRMNIALGHISVLIWTILMGVHLYVVKMGCKSIADVEKGFLIFYRPNVLLGIIVFSLLSFWIYTYHILKSSNLEENC